jgi:hypothetical protein
MWVALSNEFFAAAWRVGVSQPSNDVQYNQDDRDHHQRMNPIAGAGKPCAHVPAEKPKSHKIIKLTISA